MLKVVVFDSGWGGDLVADYIEENLPVIEVIRVIDWRDAPYRQYGKREINRRVARVLEPYYRKADLVVVASFMAQHTLKYLRRRYPKQRFLSVKWPHQLQHRTGCRNVLVLADSRTRRLPAYKNWRKTLKDYTLFEPNCDHWTALADDGLLTDEHVQWLFNEYEENKIDTIVLGNTHLWDLHPQIEKVVGKQATIVDGREHLLNRICLALDLPGAIYYYK